MGLTENVRAALAAELGAAAEELQVSPGPGGSVTLSGTVEDEGARAVALRVAARAPGVSEVRDRLTVKPDLGAEAQAKDTEFRTEASTHAMTTDGFDKIT